MSQLSQIKNNLIQIIKSNFNIELDCHLIPHADFKVAHVYSNCSKEIAKYTKQSTFEINQIIAKQFNNPAIEIIPIKDYLNFKFNEQLIFDLDSDSKLTQKTGIYLPNLDQCQSKLAFYRILSLAVYQLFLNQISKNQVSVFYQGNFYNNWKDLLASIDYKENLMQLESKSIFNKVYDFINLDKFDTKLVWVSTGVLHSKDFQELYLASQQSKTIIKLPKKRWLYGKDLHISNLNLSNILYLASDLAADDLELYFSGLQENSNLPWCIESILIRAQKLLNNLSGELVFEQPELLLRLKLFLSFADYANLGEIKAFDDNLKLIIKLLMLNLNDPKFRIELAKGTCQRARFLSYIIKQFGGMVTCFLDKNANV